VSYAAVHVPGAVALWEPELPNYAGWFLHNDEPVLLVGETGGLEEIVRHLIRLGFDRIEGFAAGLLRREGWENLTVVLGGLAGWNSMSCPLPPGEGECAVRVR